MSYDQGLDQAAVDLIRARVYITMLMAQAHGKQPGGVFHLWFPEPRTTSYVLRDGNPPASKDRPPWLRRNRLVIDTTDVPASVLTAIRGRIRHRKGDRSLPVDDRAYAQIIDQYVKDRVIARGALRTQ
jgi:hypothetical protein